MSYSDIDHAIKVLEWKYRNGCHSRMSKTFKKNAIHSSVKSGKALTSTSEKYVGPY